MTSSWLHRLISKAQLDWEGLMSAEIRAPLCSFVTEALLRYTSDRGTPWASDDNPAPCPPPFHYGTWKANSQTPREGAEAQATLNHQPLLPFPPEQGKQESAGPAGNPSVWLHHGMCDLLIISRDLAWERSDPFLPPKWNVALATTGWGRYLLFFEESDFRKHPDPQGWLPPKSHAWRGREG